MAVADCIPPIDIPSLPVLNLPFDVLLQQMQDSLYKSPDPSQLIMPMLTQMQLALSPIRQLLAMVKAVVAIKKCAEAVPDAISTLSPSKIYDCFPAFAEAFALLVKYIPPVSYVVTLLDVCTLLVFMIDVEFAFLQFLDNRITKIKETFTLAQETNDTALVAMTQCWTREVNVKLAASLNPLQVIAPIIEVVTEAVKEFFPSGADDQINSLTSTFAGMQASQQKFVDELVIPTNLEELTAPLATARDIIVKIYQLAAPIAFKDPKALVRKSPPSFVNF